ncbi:aminotransferase class V-fold PLP-dependent enzyme [Paractinoplanes brasiliensis]|uniref:Cysteine desulfurase/selenocysteine lyase n=1 Tax=Paractinoplanes brasiliensis TaxID=52695 RepID=A0A4R6JVV7_9ACTN|nr:aminotransferase class V-fold PLP-dependent enzyme [Actinoplanes brasiliensis]TDO39711.1 cysteine desulfurase/selenocysteine lyase [Actinoplanes brasiliensis]GID28952.1 cysteine desulfurase [Actinoplanes brasiliensis]
MTLTLETSWPVGVRSQFPLLMANPGVAYLDSAATSQKPQVVLDAVMSYLTSENANAARGTYPWANRTTARIEDTRDRVRRFLHAGDRSGVHFVDGTTAGLRTVALDWLVSFLSDGDEIIVPFADHSANLVPWLDAVALLERQGVRVTVRPMPYDAAHDYDVARLPIGPRTRFIAATHVHHVYGNDMNVHRLRAAAGPDIPICLDAAQSFGHMPISADALDVDFIVFSGHKAMALPGIGAVWAANKRGPVFQPAGWSGSPNTAGIVSLAAAMDWLSSVGLPRISAHIVALGGRLTAGLSALHSYEVLGCQDSLAAGSAVQRRHGIVTFRHREIGSNDLGFILASDGLLVRADGHCQGTEGEKTSSVRVSLHVYNTAEEVDRLLSVLSALD